MSKIRHTYDLVIAIEMQPAAVLLTTGNEAIIEPNGKSYCELGKMRASAVVAEDVSDADARRKAIATACFFYKKDNPEWAEAKLVGLSPELVKRSLVR